MHIGFFSVRNIGVISLMLSMAAAVPCAAKAMPLIPAPVIVAEQPTNWVGSTKAGFRNVLSGKIFYTLDGSNPTNRSTQYQEGDQITIDHSLTLKGVHVLSGNMSDVVSMDFVRAKVPALSARFGGKPSFYPSLLCTLQVAQANLGAAIRYTLNGTAPGPAGTLYTAPIKIDKSETLRAYASLQGYDDADPISTPFVLLEPPALPVANPKGQNFSTNTLNIKFTTATPGSYFRYTLDTALKSLENARIVEGDSLSILGGTARDTTYLRVIACKSGYPSSAVVTEKYVYLPAVATPTISKPQGFFYDSITLVLSGAKGSNVRYVTDNSVITASSLDGSLPIHLFTGATVKAQAFNPPQPASGILTAAYTLRLSPPDLDKQSQEFVGSLDVKLTSKSKGAFIYYTFDGSVPTLKSSPLDTSGKVTVTAEGETVLKAVAYKDGIFSDPATAVYTRQAVVQKLSAPIITPAAQDFVDTLSIRMLTDEANAEIRYTTDGSDPGPASPKYGTNPIHLDSSAVLRAQCFPIAGNLLASVVREEKYTLNPSPPIADPPAGIAYANSVQITLRTNTKKGIIKYVLGNTPLDGNLASTYQEGHPILLNSTTRLQALTALATGGAPKYSSTLDLTYEVYTSNPSDSLQPGSTRSLTGNFQFNNASDQPITAKTHSTDILGLTGFSNASLAVQLLPVQAGQAIRVLYSKPLDNGSSLFRYAGGSVEFITSASQAVLTVPGDYFTGIDTLPPAISLVSESAKAGDSTVLRLSVLDNVLNPTCEIQSAGLAGGKLSVKPDAGGLVTASLKLAGGDLKGLWFRAVSQDSRNTARLPTDAAGKLYLDQIWGRMTTPSVLALGRANSAWDMAGFPLGGTASIPWRQVREDNAAGNLDAAVWDEAAQQYAYLGDSSLIKPGMAFWIGSRTAMSSVALSGLQTAGSQNDGTFRMPLHPGWNQVTSPSPDRVYWPTTLAASKSPTVYVKAPYRYVAEVNDYVQCDSLEPWRGYFVNYFGTRDTVITVYTNASKRPAAKVSAAQGQAGALLSLDFGRTIPLTLGARIDAQDGLGAEDEPDMPALTRRFTAWSQRGSRHLLTDMVRLVPGEVLHWDVVVGDLGTQASGTAGSGKFRVLEHSLPPGYEAWAVSSARHMRFPLQPGTEMPFSGMAGDTLSVYAGPLGKLQAISEFSAAATKVETFSFALEKGREGRLLKLALPWAAKVDVGVWSPSGRLLAAIRPGSLNQGIYRLVLMGSQKSAGETPQIAFIRVRMATPDGAREVSQKAIW